MVTVMHLRDAKVMVSQYLEISSKLTVVLRAGLPRSRLQLLSLMLKPSILLSLMLCENQFG